jgi:hypothetical protein
MITLGCKAKDMVSGFKGVVVARIEYLWGCTQYGLAPDVNKNGNILDTQYFDYKRIEVIGKGKHIASEDTGGPQRDQPR